MYRKTVIVGLSSLWMSTAVLAEGTAIPSNPGTVVLSSAVEAKCFAEAAGEALSSSQGQGNWWQPLGYKSAAEWFAAALSYATIGISADARFDVIRGNKDGLDQLDFRVNVNGATLVLAATAAKNSANRFARTWREDWTYSPRYAGVTWVSGKARAGRRAVGGAFGGSAAGAGTSLGNTLSITGTNITEFTNHLTLNAGAWSVAASGSYAGLFDQAAAAMGQRIPPKASRAAARALATALADATLTADVDLHYQTRNGEVTVNSAEVSVACGAGAAVTAEGYATPN